jgi:hypothetical protein
MLPVHDRLDRIAVPVSVKIQKVPGIEERLHILQGIFQLLELSVGEKKGNPFIFQQGLYPGFLENREWGKWFPFQAAYAASVRLGLQKLPVPLQKPGDDFQGAFLVAFALGYIVDLLPGQGSLKSLAKDPGSYLVIAAIQF